MRWRWIFSVFPDVQSFKKSTKEKHWFEMNEFFFRDRWVLLYTILFQMEAPVWGHFETPGPLTGKERVPDQTSSTPCCIQMLTVEKQNEWSFVSPDWALQCQLLFWKVKRYLLHLLGKWAAACFGRDCYYGEVLSLALYFWLYVFTSAWISPAITALWLND